jgi:hypothetical protein
MTAANEPITEMVVNSMITAPQQGHTMRAAETAEIRGLAWDGGYGIKRVEISVDGGHDWHDAELGKDVGRFAFRAFRFAFTASARPRPTSSSSTRRATTTTSSVH